MTTIVQNEWMTGRLGESKFSHRKRKASGELDILKKLLVLFFLLGDIHLLISKVHEVYYGRHLKTLELVGPNGIITD